MVILVIIGLLVVIGITLLNHRHVNRLFGMQADFERYTHAGYSYDDARRLVRDAWPFWRLH